MTKASSTKDSSGNTNTARRVGNVLIALSIMFFIVLYAPFALLLLPNDQAEVFASQSEGMSIYIPKISASAPVVSNVNPWDEKEYRQKLKLGVAHAAGSSLPGEKGTSYLFAHSSDLPWNLTRYNTAFFRLGQLDNGDEIKIKKDGKEIVYLVIETKVVLPRDVKYLTQPSTKDQLILQTCTPIGTSFKRLLVFAEPIS